MAEKKVAFGGKPTRERVPTSVDDFVKGGAAHQHEPEDVAAPDGQIGTQPGNSGKLKRLTIDLSPELHSRIKVECAKSGRTMAAEVRAILEQRFSVNP